VPHGRRSGRFQLGNVSQTGLNVAPSTSAEHQVWSPGSPHAPI
jgi:hypothetical protein